MNRKDAKSAKEEEKKMSLNIIRYLPGLMQLQQHFGYLTFEKWQRDRFLAAIVCAIASSFYR
ncbi:hypothetical protein WA1_00025 [Scytonema hofmannii PCC 7110]|uniref:Uncharacterized protein n=1 Tax=Scytonema hofmannii PCC 7110 TaxID=128403 RepID=A0A139XFX7_9CYAN|nr:hypothetical protein [Scytonema hofmannii]KYC43600.1 hypothetical protein WA1_00025 [Scytonema hofmannii PCC 7110]